MNEHVGSYLLILSAFSFFIVCPRMAAMTNLIARNFSVSIYWMVILGTAFSIPLLLAMTFIIQRWGLTGGLAFAILTDILASLVVGAVSVKAGIEPLIIAVFVVAGNRIATWITAKLF